MDFLYVIQNPLYFQFSFFYYLTTKKFVSMLACFVWTASELHLYTYVCITVGGMHLYVPKHTQAYEFVCFRTCQFQ